jgi:alkylation response protein AidB-like acyl-CoA dehydrogenase
MDINFSAEDLAFRDEARSFIEQNYPPELRNKPLHTFEKEDYLVWHRLLHKKGWVAPSWPTEYGGTGWDITKRYIWGEEVGRADTVRLLPFGLNMVAPVIYTFGSDEQKKYYLPRILSGEDWWCQGYSEPGSGSDLASLSTKAVRDGDDYIVNGHKIWTTLAQHADMMFCLVRTDPKAEKQQQGISFLLIDMNSPGITVRPIITVDGSHEVNEIFLENVRVPIKNRVGEENQGWTYAKFLLAHERSGIAGVSASKKGIERIKEIARGVRVNGGALLDEESFQRKIAETEMELTALEYTELRTLAGERSGQGPGPESSILKIRGTEIQQRRTELVLEAVGSYIHAPSGLAQHNIPGMPEFASSAATTYFNQRKTTIYGGSNEIQRNIIAKMVLGL